MADIDLGRVIAGRAVVLFRLGGPPAAGSPAMLSRLICQDLLRAAATPDGTSGGGTSGGGGDGLIWLAECGALPRQAVTSLIARGRAAGLPVLAATTSAPVAAELADLVNVVIAHRMAAGAAAPWAANGAATSWLSAAADPATLRDGEFLLAVRDPPRLVPSGLMVRARVPKVTRDERAAAPRRAWEGA